ncbi:MAG: carboxymuconolactone decarboxylase family protein [Candidatus Hydrogenedentes bacterium]|nr:carboxymuconolactone decarboxylase family protein [Candidatus Hydrogenedentota bacterium]
MKARMNFFKASPGATQAMLDLTQYVKDCGLEASLQELVKLRASQINGCAYCIDMHSLDARALGETEQRIYCLSTWRECPFYTERERAALEWTEALTLITEGHVPDEVYDRARTQFSEEELVQLSLAIVTINAWNRIAISFRSVPGHYKPTHAK